MELVICSLFLFFIYNFLIINEHLVFNDDIRVIATTKICFFDKYLLWRRPNTSSFMILIEVEVALFI